MEGQKGSFHLKTGKWWMIKQLDGQLSKKGDLLSSLPSKAPFMI